MQHNQNLVQKRILLIEDDISLCETYLCMLSEEGFVVEVANDGEAGLMLIESNIYDLILLDVILPKMNGVEIVSRVFKSDFPQKDLRIVLLSNLAQESIIVEALKAGAEEFILKSNVLPEDLVQNVKELLQKKQAT